MTSEERAKETADRNEIDLHWYKRRTMWIDEDQWTGMKRAAVQDGRSVSAWLRALIKKVLKDNA